MSMKKYLIALFITVPFFASAQTFDQDLFYGLRQNEDVKELQEFLADKGFYDGSATGNFFSLTLSSVKKFQTAHGIAPASGYFGPKSRAKANELLAASGITKTEIATESGTTTTPITIAPKTTDNVVSSLMEQIKILQQQLTALQQSQQTLSSQAATIQTIQQEQKAQTQTLQQIQQNTTPPPPPPVITEPTPTTIDLSFTSNVINSYPGNVSVTSSRKVTFKKLRVAVGEYDTSGDWQIAALTAVDNTWEFNVTRPPTLTDQGGYFDFSFDKFAARGITADELTAPFHISYGSGYVDPVEGAIKRNFTGMFYGFTMTIKADGTEIVDDLGRNVPLPKDYSVRVILNTR
ncbi:MAG TPA: peptidoglycan-binding domain-containing protein [Candidatus Paceibacterota bacterium]